MNATFLKPEQKSHPVLKPDNSRSDIAQWFTRRINDTIIVGQVEAKITIA